MNEATWFLLYLRVDSQRDAKEKKTLLLSTIALETVNLLSRKFFLFAAAEQYRDVT